MMRLLLLALTTFLTGCSSSSGSYYTQSIDSWRGANAKSLVSIWGTPDQKIIERSGKSLLVYRKTSFTAEEKFYSPRIGVSTNSKGQPVIINTNDVNEFWNRNLALTCTIMFSVSASHIITNSKILGTNCVISDELARQLENPNKR